MALIEELQKIVNDELIKAVFSNSKDRVKKIIIRPIKMDEILKWHVESFIDEKVYHENLEYDELFDFLSANVAEKFKQANLLFPEYTKQVRVSKKNKIFVTENKNEKLLTADYNHNQNKEYILKEGEDIKPLKDLGIFTEDNKIINSKYDKFRQINKFVEIIDHEFKNSKETELNIVDFGCGKSYLTFIMYYYFKYIKKIENLNIVGYDLKDDVVEKCNEIARKYKYDGLSFHAGDIADIKQDIKIDMMVTLHACDTATDFALYNAITNDIKYIFSVPCCQHEINSQIENKNEMSLMLEHGIIKERFSALLTDSIRCEILKDQGYDVDVLEFVDFSHTPKNIMLRAKKKNKAVNDKTKVEKVLNDFSSQQKLFELIYD